MQGKAFNPQIFLELLCYCVFGGLMFYLVSSGTYLSYVTPRMEPYLYFTAIVMLIWACAGLSRLFRPQHKVRSAHCFVLAIPVLLLLLPHSPLRTSDLSGTYIGGNTFANQPGQSFNGLQNQGPSDRSGSNAAAGIQAEDSAAIGTEPGDDPTSQIGEATTPADSTNAPDTQTALPGLDAANKKITVSNEAFGLWLSELYMNMDQYEGYTVVMTGFVFKDPELLKGDEFVPARLMMSCCVADLAPAGLLCKYDKASELKADAWVTVEGTLVIGQTEYDGQTYENPQLTVTKITPAEEVEGYVYPY